LFSEHRERNLRGVSAQHLVGIFHITRFRLVN
jgi:hypothetical protein